MSTGQSEGRQIKRLHRQNMNPKRPDGKFKGSGKFASYKQDNPNVEYRGKKQNKKVKGYQRDNKGRFIKKK